MRAARHSKLGLFAQFVLVGGLLVASTGCATITGTATGALTGLVDGPAAVARAHHESFRDHPEYWILDVLIVAPLSVAVGPFAGFIKGIAVDVQWLRGEQKYRTAFTTYQDSSIWRPWTLHWEHGGSAMSVMGSSSPGSR